MLSEFFDRATFKTIEIFISNPTTPMTSTEVLKNGRYNPKEINTIHVLLAKLAENEMIFVEDPDVDPREYTYICNIKSKLVINLMNLDIELLSRDLENKKRTRAKSYTYAQKSTPALQEAKEEIAEAQKADEQKPVEGSA